MEILKIRWIGDTRGSMEIAMDSFFPCNKTNLKKLLKIIAISEQPPAAVDKIKIFLPKQLEQLESLKKQYANDYFNTRQNVADLTALIETGKFSNGVPLSQKDLKNRKLSLKLEKSKMNVAKRLFNKANKSLSQCKMNIESMNEVIT